MKKLIFVCLTVLYCACLAFSAREFAEGTDYSVDFKQNEDGKAAVLHINFTDAYPSAQEAESLIKDQLEIYGKIIDGETAEKKKKENEEEAFKNIIGSVWVVQENLELPVKIKFNDSLSAYVYLGKTKKIVQFPEYIAFLKKERDDKKAKDKLKAAKQKQEDVKIDFQE